MLDDSDDDEALLALDGAAERLARYQLHSVVSHLGALASSGHYIADVHDAAQHCWVRLTPY